MPISFTCPHCGTQTNVDDQYAGQTGPCASCGQPVTIPMPFGASTAMPPPPYSPRKSTGVSVGVILAILLGVLFFCGGPLIALLLPAVQAAREAARRSQCSNNLKQISLAMHSYHDVYKSFPPAVITDENGVPRYSWRVAILPFMEQKPLFDRWDPNEAWDGPNNSMLGQTSIPQYRCPSAGDGIPWETNYVMITGPEALGNVPNEATQMRDISDGTSNTLMIVEVVDSGIGWSEPRDLSFQEAELMMSSWHPGGYNVAYADGSVRFLSETMAPGMLQALITMAGGEAVNNW